MPLLQLIYCNYNENHQSINNQSINQSINQSLSQSINQSINQGTRFINHRAHCVGGRWPGLLDRSDKGQPLSTGQQHFVLQTHQGQCLWEPPIRRLHGSMWRRVHRLCTGTHCIGGHRKHPEEVRTLLLFVITMC